MGKKSSKPTRQLEKPDLLYKIRKEALTLKTRSDYCPTFKYENILKYRSPLKSAIYSEFDFLFDSLTTQIRKSPYLKDVTPNSSLIASLTSFPFTNNTERCEYVSYKQITNISKWFFKSCRTKKNEIVEWKIFEHLNYDHSLYNEMVLYKEDNVKNFQFEMFECVDKDTSEQQIMRSKSEVTKEIDRSKLGREIVRSITKKERVDFIQSIRRNRSVDEFSRRRQKKYEENCSIVNSFYKVFNRIEENDKSDMQFDFASSDSEDEELKKKRELLDDFKKKKRQKQIDERKNKKKGFNLYGKPKMRNYDKPTKRKENEVKVRVDLRNNSVKVEIICEEEKQFLEKEPYLFMKPELLFNKNCAGKVGS